MKEMGAMRTHSRTQQASQATFGPMISGTMAQARFEAMFDHTPKIDTYAIETAAIAAQIRSAS
jgi:hypothetical protein